MKGHQSDGPALKWACPSQKERIDDKTSFVSLHSRTFITALKRSDRGSEEETNEGARSNALPVGSFTRREPRQKIVFLSGAERREREPTILFRRCLWPPRNVFLFCRTLSVFALFSCHHRSRYESSHFCSPKTGQIFFMQASVSPVKIGARCGILCVCETASSARQTLRYSTVKSSVFPGQVGLPTSAVY